MKLISKLSTLALVALSSVSLSYSQQQGPNRGVAGVTGVIVKYNWCAGDKAIGEPFTLLADHDFSLIEVDKNEDIFVNYEDKTINRVATLSNGEIISSEEKLPANHTIRLIKDKEESLFTWSCKRYEVKTENAVYEYVTTDNLGYYGTPMPELAIPQTLVLEIYKDGKLICKATKLDRTIYQMELTPKSLGRLVNTLEYKTSVINDSINNAK